MKPKSPTPLISLSQAAEPTMAPEMSDMPGMDH